MSVATNGSSSFHASLQTSEHPAALRETGVQDFETFSKQVTLSKRDSEVMSRFAKLA
jgi:hypothetical protein